MVNIGNDWDDILAGEWDKPYYRELRNYLKEEYSRGTVYPPAGDIFNALKLTPFEDTKVVILGQDPYHEPGQAQGLSFSVPDGVQKPPSLVNILKELESDLAVTRGGIGGLQRSNAAPAGSAHGTQPGGLSGVLVPWARQGVLLLNTVLTVRAHEAGSHRGRGWETFTDTVIEKLAAREAPMVFILWGSNAGAKTDLIISTQRTSAHDSGHLRHLIIRAPHPSPLSAYRGFFGGRYFSRANYFLVDNGMEPIDWSL